MSQSDRSALTAQAMLKALRNSQSNTQVQPLPQNKKGFWSNLPAHYIVIKEESKQEG